MKQHSMVRKIIVFAIFFITLGIIAPALIFYSLGYRIDKDNNTFIQSGSVVVKSTPASPKISIDGKEIEQKSIDLINRSLNINGLNPNKYEMEISAEGYNSWKKSFEINAGIATEFWNIVLVPQKIEPKTILSDNLVKYAFSPDKSKIAFFINKEDGVTLFIRGENQAEDTLVFKESSNQRYKPEPKEIKWSPDGQWLLFSLNKNNEEEIFLTFADTNYSELISVGDVWKNTLSDKTEQQKEKKKTTPNFKINSYTWGGQNDIFFTATGKLYSQPASYVLDWSRSQQSNNNVSKEVNGNVNSQKKDNAKKTEAPAVFSANTLPLQIKDNISGFTFCGNSMCSVNVPERKLEVFSQGGDPQKNVKFPENYEMTDRYELFAYSNDQTAILDSNNNLFLWDEAQNKLDGEEGMKFIFSGVKEVYFSNDGKKLLFLTQKEAYVYFVKDWEVQPKHISGDLEVIYRDPNELQKVQWYLDYQNIFIENKDGIKMVELDGRGGRNSQDFVTNPNISDLGYDTADRKLWFIEKNENGTSNLQEIPFPVTQSLFSGIMSGQKSQ